jgi:regulator of cell morphogenesis and NO signaling
MTPIAASASLDSRFVQPGIGGGRAVERELAAISSAGNLDPIAIVIERHPADRDTDCNGDVSWKRRKLSALVAHIVDSHHAYLRRELPRLGILMAKGVAECGLTNPALRQLAPVFSALESDITTHMRKEETIVFPWVRAMDEARKVDRVNCLTVRGPIRIVQEEHRVTDDAIAKMRRLTNDFTPPPTACPTMQALYASLEALDRDLRRHLHEENNILFPRAIEMERRLAL